MRAAVAFVALAGCAGAPPPAVQAPAAAPAPAPRPSVERAPGPIAGAWRVTCPENAGEIIEFTVDGRKAVGRVVEPGAATRYGFQAGEEVFRLQADSYGQWVGDVHWRGVAAAEHWDSIRFVASPTVLDATMTNERCYRDMPRAERRTR
jgi:hypothetical protein